MDYNREMVRQRVEKKTQAVDQLVQAKATFVKESREVTKEDARFLFYSNISALC